MITYRKKKAQLEMPLITFVFIAIGLLLTAVFTLKVVNMVLTPFGSAVGNVSVTAGQNVAHIQGSFTNFWDFVIIMAFVINILLLFVTAFLVDTHPFFLILYIIFGFLTFIFAPEVLRLVIVIYENPAFVAETNTLQMVGFIKDYFGLVLLGIFFISGIIMYAKFKLFGQSA